MPDHVGLTSATIAGAVAGNLTVTGIKAGDRLILVQVVSAVGANLIAEFTVTADNTINNTGGTSTATKTVLVMWERTGGGRSKFNSTRTGRSTS